MAKPKDRSEVEFLRGEVKKLRSALKHYKKELSRANKRSRDYQELEELVQDQELEIEEQTKLVPSGGCSKCQSDKVTLADLGAKVYRFCSNCGHREKIK